MSGAPLPTDPDAGFAPLPRRETLTSQLAKTLGERITAGEYAAGSKLPTEQELVEAFGVSRTVVREAISLLKAGGMVTTRQGVGVFVTQAETARPFRVEEARLDVLREVIAVVELRIGVEAEGASLAAQRRTEADLAALAAATGNLNSALYDSGSYLRIFRRSGGTEAMPHGTSLVFFPLDTDRIRLGYLYDISWDRPHIQRNVP